MAVVNNWIVLVVIWHSILEAEVDINNFVIFMVINSHNYLVKAFMVIGYNLFGYLLELAF